MRLLGFRVVGLACLVALAGCTTNKSIANITTVPGKLQLAVGTINDSAGTLGIGGTTVNIVATFRNPFGNSAFQNPGQYTLTGPAGTIVAPSASPCDRIYGYGDFPGCESDGLGEALWGVPPQYNPPNPNGGYSLGFIQTGAAATAGGAYTLSMSVPVNGGMSPYSKTATMPAPLPVIANATGVVTFTSDGLGGGTFTIGNPAALPRARVRPGKFARPSVSTKTPTEFLIVVSNNALGIVATIETTGTSATITGMGDCSNPMVGGSPIPCGANTAYVIDADYPLVEDGPPANSQQTPNLAPGGSADISVSGTSTINE